LLQFITLTLILTNDITFLKPKKHQSNSTNSTNIKNDSNGEPKEHLGYCFMKINNIFYDLTPLTAQNASSSYKTYTSSGEQINFNVCGKNAKSVCSNKNSMAVSNVRCTEYAGDIDQDRTWTLSTSNLTNSSMLTLQLPTGDVCQQNGTNGTGPIYYTTLYEFTCDRKKNFEIRKDSKFSASACTNTIHMNTKHACPKEKFSPWYKQFGVPKQAVAVSLIMIGLYFLICGVTFWKINNFLINFACQGLIIYSFLNLFMNVNLMLCMLLGLVVALAVFYFPKAVSISLGIVVGYLFGTLSYNLFVKIIPVNPQTLYWSLIILCVVGLSVLGGFIDEYMIVICTSLVGGYAFVRGISLFAGNYPDESYVMKLLNHGEYSQFGRVYGSHIYVYMFGIFAMTGVGVLIQSFLIPKEFAEGKGEKKEEEKKQEDQKKEEEKKNNENLPVATTSAFEKKDEHDDKTNLISKPEGEAEKAKEGEK